jgi:hypothetical protein
MGGYVGACKRFEREAGERVAVPRPSLIDIPSCTRKKHNLVQYTVLVAQTDNFRKFDALT